MAPSQSPQRLGIALRETILVIVVLGMLLALGLPMLLQRQTTARRVLCRERQRQLWIATTAYEETNRSYPTYQFQLPDDSLPLVSWAGAILPLLAKSAQSDLEPQMRVDRFLDAAPGKRGRLDEILIPELMCPTDVRIENRARKAFNSFVANTGMPDVDATEEGPADWPANGVLLVDHDLARYRVKPNSRAIIKKCDGLNHTLLFTENLDAGLWTDSSEPQVGFVWMAGFADGAASHDELVLGVNQLVGKGDGSYRFARPASLHPLGVNVVYCGGRLQLLADDIDHVVLANLMNSNIYETREPGSATPLRPPYHLEQEILEQDAEEESTMPPAERQRPPQ